MSVSKARAMVSPQDVVTWFRNLEDFVLVKPDIREAFTDPNRIWNTVRPWLYLACVYILT